MHRVVRIRGKLPDLGRAQLGAGVDARGVEHLAVDGPHYVAVRRSLAKCELARKPRAGLAERLERAHIRESLGHRALFLSLRTTWKRITREVVPSPRRFFSVTFVPTGYLEKSITTSKRSAGAMGIVRWGMGAPSSPPSLPTCTKGRPSDGLGSSASL